MAEDRQPGFQVRLLAENERLREALTQIAATVPKQNLAREIVHVPVLDGFQAQKIAAAVLRTEGAS